MRARKDPTYENSTQSIPYVPDDGPGFPTPILEKSGPYLENKISKTRTASHNRRLRNHLYHHHRTGPIMAELQEHR